MDEFGSEPTCLQGLLQMLHMFTELTLPLLSGEGGLVNHPDTVDDLFRLCYRCVCVCVLCVCVCVCVCVVCVCDLTITIHVCDQIKGVVTMTWALHWGMGLPTS